MLLPERILVVRLNNSLATQGIAFVAALAIMVMLTILGLSFMYMIRMDMIVNRNQFEALRAINYAESAVEHSIAEIRSGVDLNGDGLGTIPLKDISGDGVNDYQATYVSSTAQITGIGVGASNANQTVKVDLDLKKWTGAMQAGAIQANTSDAGVINGNVDSKASINMSPSITVNGTVIPNDAAMSVATPDMAAYNAIANYHYSGSPIWNGQPPNGNGMYYITGNLTINAVNNFNLIGTIIATGTIQISSMIGTITITASGKNPALVSGGAMTISASQSSNITGLVYAGTTMMLSTLSGTTQINGALVSGGQTDVQTVGNLQLTFDTTLNPPNFNGGGGGPPQIKLWRGHP